MLDFVKKLFGLKTRNGVHPLDGATRQAQEAPYKLEPSVQPAKTTDSKPKRTPKPKAPKAEKPKAPKAGKPKKEMTPSTKPKKPKTKKGV